MSKCDECRLRIFCPYENVADAEIMAHCVHYIPPERTCRNDALKSDQFVCTECGKWYDIVDMDDDDWGGVPNYCPNCGAKVVD